MGTLYIVSTPIGNLEDITLRALRILKSVSLIAAEDTRTTSVLLKHYEIRTPLISNHNLNERTKVDQLIETLSTSDVAIVSDAGTPVINDPGYPLILAAIQAGVTVVPIPGASSPITALSVSGLPADEFYYAGYIPKKSNDRKAFFNRLIHFQATLIFLETPHRIIASLKDMKDVFGNRKISVCRELTKYYEEVLRTDIDAARQHFEMVDPLGEFTLVVEGAKAPENWTAEQVTLAIRQGLSSQLRASELSKQISVQSGWPRKEIYSLIEEQKINL